MTRRLLFGVPAVLIALALVLPTAPAAAGGRKVVLGVSIEGLNRQPTTFDHFAWQVGNRPRIWTLWSQWGNESTKRFPRWAADWVGSKGAVPFIFWEPYKHGAGDPCAYSDHRRIANGAHDGYIRQWARDAKRYGRTVLLRWAHEINGAFFPWGIKNRTCNDSVGDYKRAWKRIVRIFRNAGARNVKFVWSVSKSSCRGGCNPYDEYYPGSKWVHYVGFSNFNWGAYKGQWVPMVSGVSDVMVKFRQFTRKPVIIAENATNTFGGYKPGWIRQGYQAVYRRWPQIKAIVYLNVDLSPRHPDWSLTRPGPWVLGAVSASHRAYEDIADQQRFRGRIR